ncbi:hypothetical protein EYF80_005382 [Liparis tanakae]|uniref:Uncharacterized protein n=1 Tax=Liparis tanakae TaxID=230148 RepID=A0A4Z2J2E8_9TELE|nr:hypothetical protein EYF80_005382 [Liparis tanakae]
MAFMACSTQYWGSRGAFEHACVYNVRAHKGSLHSFNLLSQQLVCQRLVEAHCRKLTGTFIRTVQHALPGHHSGVVHQHRDVPAQVLSHKLCTAIHVSPVGHIHRVSVRLTAQRTHQRGCLLVGTAVYVPQHHLGPVLGEFLSKETTQAAT